MRLRCSDDKLIGKLLLRTGILISYFTTIWPDNRLSRKRRCRIPVERASGTTSVQILLIGMLHVRICAGLSEKITCMTERTWLLTNLPRQTTSFVGRREEIAEISAFLENPVCQLLTLVGPGGIGKTRLALEVARRVSDLYVDGVYFVALQPLRSPEDIPPAIIHALGVPIHGDDNPLKQLMYYLHDRRLLLVLDNFEHLIEGVGLVAAIVMGAPDIRLLVTSREALNVREEWQWPVKGLRFPKGAPDDDAEAYGAIRLFAERARQIQPEFALADQLVAVTHICRLVEGIPLAIEIAANWTKTLTCDAIVDAIQNDIDFLTSREHNIPERHRSMRAVYNHSWRQLSEEERKVFENSSVFRGGFTRKASEVVAGATLATLATLVDKSFLRQDTTGRYDMHELLRQYGAEQLASFGASAAADDKHAAYFAEFLTQCEAELRSSQQLIALNKIEADFENIRAAWSHAAAKCEYERVDRMIDSLYFFDQWRDRHAEVRALFEMAATAFAPDADTLAHPVLSRILVRISQAQIDTFDRALEVARAHGNSAEAAFCLLKRGLYHAQRHHFASAVSDFEAGLEAYQALGDSFGTLLALSDLAYYSVTIGDAKSFRLYITQGTRLARETGNYVLLYRFQFHTGWLACFEGRYDASERDLREALTIANQMNFRAMEADTIGSLGFLAFLRGDFQRARDWILHDLETVTQVKAVGEQGFAKIVLAHIVCIEGDYSEARQHAEEALILVQPHPIRERFITRVLAMAECGLENFDRAREYAHAVLVEELYPGIRLWILPVFALLLAHDGNPESAAELLGLLFTHPASATGWLEKWSLLNDLRARLVTQLGIDNYASAWERGTKLDLDTVVDDLLVATDNQARQPLAEPLTDRELEVLHLVAAGLSNHDIASVLTVVEGTVRSHVYHLYQKLSVSSRTQAIARARALHILH